MFLVDLVELIEVLGDHHHEVVDLPDQFVTANDRIELLNLGLKGIQFAARGGFHPDEQKYSEAQADGGGVHLCCEPSDDPRSHELGNSPRACSLTQVDKFAEVTVGYAPVILKGRKNIYVCHVHNTELLHMPC